MADQALYSKSVKEFESGVFRDYCELIEIALFKHFKGRREIEKIVLRLVIIVHNT